MPVAIVDATNLRIYELTPDTAYRFVVQSRTVCVNESEPAVGGVTVPPSPVSHNPCVQADQRAQYSSPATARTAR